MCNVHVHAHAHAHVHVYVTLIVTASDHSYFSRKVLFDSRSF